MKNDLRSLRDYFQSLPVYTPAFDETIEAVVARIDMRVVKKKGEVISELSPENKDFWFLTNGFLKEMYRNSYQQSDALFNVIPPRSIFVNEDTLFLDKHPQHYYLAQTDVTILRFSQQAFEEIFQQFPLVQLLYVSGTAEIQKNRRARLMLLRMPKTIDRVHWVRTYRPELFRNMDRITLAQYIGVSRASLYRAFEKTDKFQY